MSFLSSPAFAAQSALKAQSITISRSQVFEVIAALFGYHNFSEMLADNETLEFHLVHDSPRTLVILQGDLGYRRAADILKDQVNSEQLVQIVNVIAHHTLQMFPGRSFLSDDQFIDLYLTPAVRHFIFHDSNHSVLAAQDKAGAFCDFFVRDDIDFPAIMDERSAFWSGSLGAMLYRTNADGSPAISENQVVTGSKIVFPKIGRVLLSKNFEIRTDATAFTPHAAMGGVRL